MVRIGLRALFLDAFEDFVEVAEQGLVVVGVPILLLLVAFGEFGEFLAHRALIVLSHERAFVEALEPTHAVLLPDEFYDLWRDEYLDEVEQR